MLCIPFQALVFYKVYSSAFLPRRRSNTGCWSFELFVQWEDNVVYLTWHIWQETLFFQQLSDANYNNVNDTLEAMTDAKQQIIPFENSSY
jgi:quinol monooxygenase YgiN